MIANTIMGISVMEEKQKAILQQRREFKPSILRS